MTGTETLTAATPAAARAGVARNARNASAFSLHEKIDICRGLFAALVVMAHSLEIAWGVFPQAKASLPPLTHDLIFGVFGTGTYYVMGFFVISGYCIHLSVARSMGASHFPIGQYTAARLTRILPLYYVGLLTTLAVEWLIAGARPFEWPNGLDAQTFLCQVVMVQNLTQTFGSFASSWSITNEVFYYLFYGLLAWLLAGRTARPAWLGLGLCLAAAVAGQVLYVTVGRNPYVYSTGMLFGLGMLWFMGALVAIHGRDLMARGWARNVARCWPAVLIGAIAWKTAHMPPQGLYLISGFAFMLMLLDFQRSPLSTPARVSPLRSTLITTLGLSSYPMYLFHGPILMLVGSWVMRTGVVTDWRVLWLALVAIGIAAGAGLGWVLERPVMAWRSSYLRRLRESSTVQKARVLAA